MLYTDGMESLYISTTVGIAALAAFLIYLTVLKYAVENNFVRTRLIMTGFFCFIVLTLTVAFWRYTLPSLWFSIPALVFGMLVGHFVGVRTAEERLMLEGAERYMEHFAHIHFADVKKLEWWSLINFYSIAGALVIINLLGLSVVIFDGGKSWALLTCGVGAFLLGTMAPYLIHLWSISKAQNAKSTMSEA